ncbi:MAG: hypothetical protein JWO73_46 [Candidatus Taylorbacteria bacterium]|nr:hypothetical protein [Candidatus Taylorbacteria bacterium]
MQEVSNTKEPKEPTKSVMNPASQILLLIFAVTAYAGYRLLRHGAESHNVRMTAIGATLCFYCFIWAIVGPVKIGKKEKKKDEEEDTFVAAFLKIWGTQIEVPLSGYVFLNPMFPFFIKHVEVPMKQKVISIKVEDVFSKPMSDDDQSPQSEDKSEFESEGMPFDIELEFGIIPDLHALVNYTNMTDEALKARLKASAAPVLKEICCKMNWREVLNSGSGENNIGKRVMEMIDGMERNNSDFPIDIEWCTAKPTPRKGVVAAMEVNASSSVTHAAIEIETIRRFNELKRLDPKKHPSIEKVREQIVAERVLALGQMSTLTLGGKGGGKNTIEVQGGKKDKK